MHIVDYQKIRGSRQLDKRNIYIAAIICFPAAANIDFLYFLFYMCLFYYISIMFFIFFHLRERGARARCMVHFILYVYVLCILCGHVSCDRDYWRRLLPICDE
jgi:hypothetical protein